MVRHLQMAFRDTTKSGAADRGAEGEGTPDTLPFLDFGRKKKSWFFAQVPSVCGLLV